MVLLDFGMLMIIQLRLGAKTKKRTYLVYILFVQYLQMKLFWVAGQMVRLELLELTIISNFGKLIMLIRMV